MNKLPIRFLIVRTITNTLILGSLVYLGLAIYPILKEEVGYKWREYQGIAYSVDAPTSTNGQESQTNVALVASSETQEKVPADTGYFGLKKSKIAKETISVTPVSPDFGIVIEKIGVNAPVVSNVDSSSVDEYTNALRSGVAHAKGTSFPGQAGNVYIHGHSSLGFWQLGSYATVFTLLGKLEVGDRVVTFYEGERFDYEVTNKEIFPGYDITPLARDYDESVLTLQTCDPPGTTLNRLVITARLIS